MYILLDKSVISFFLSDKTMNVLLFVINYLKLSERHTDRNQMIHLCYQIVVVEYWMLSDKEVI